MTHAKSVDQKIPNAQRTVLLATERSHTIIGQIVDGKANSIAYSAYGEQSAQQNVETRMGFNGQLREANIGWYLLGNGYRTYNPRLMRFHSPDSWSPFGRGGLNAYMYCAGDPVNRSDPTGHFPNFMWVKKYVGFTNATAVGRPDRTGQLLRQVNPVAQPAGTSQVSIAKGKTPVTTAIAISDSGNKVGIKGNPPRNVGKSYRDNWTQTSMDAQTDGPASGPLLSTRSTVGNTKNSDLTLSGSAQEHSSTPHPPRLRFSSSASSDSTESEGSDADINWKPIAANFSNRFRTESTPAELARVRRGN